MRPWIEEKFANPHSPSRSGREAAAAVEVARDQVERGARAQRRPLCLHLGRDRGAQLGAQGHVRAIASAASSSPSRPSMPRCSTRPNGSEAQGIEVVRLPVGRDGLIDLDIAEAAIDDETALVAAMLVNNEIGVIQPVAELARHRPRRGRADALRRGPGLRPRARSPKGRDLVALSGHKIHGPKGIGALWMRDGAEPEPLLHGGGQERGMRSGTLSPALVRRLRRGGAAGVRAARGRSRPCRAAVGDRARNARARLDDQRQPRPSAITAISTSAAKASTRARLISDVRDVAFSLGSACASGSGRPSHVLARARPDRPRGALLDPPRLRPLHRRGGAGLRAAGRIDEAAERQQVLPA